MRLIVIFYLINIIEKRSLYLIFLGISDALKLNHCGLVMAWDIEELGHPWFQYGLFDTKSLPEPFLSSTAPLEKKITKISIEN